MTIKAFLSFAAALMTGIAANAQAMYFDNATVGEVSPDSIIVKEINTVFVTDSILVGALTADSVAVVPDSVLYRRRTLGELDHMLDSLRYEPRVNMGSAELPRYFFMPAIFDRHQFASERNPFESDITGRESQRWLEEQVAVERAMDDMRFALFSTHPENVFYTTSTLPEAPKQYHAVVDPSKHTIEIKELEKADDKSTTIAVADVQKKHWIHSFQGLLQFSQAYISPNWYQGGNNNVNMLANARYDVKLNTVYHPNLLFETTVQYKLGVNNAPNDSIHDYNITDDLFQVNTTFGIKAARRWYYSFTGQFKTQLFDFYPANSRQLKSAFMSPGELTVGIGMTYNYVNTKKTFTFDASMAPLSYGLKTCLDNRISPESYGLKANRHTKSSFGSSAEIKIFWKLASNITFRSRLFAFTDYETARADWENTLDFTINRFLSTQINVNARYDTQTRYDAESSDWHKLQLKEILSIGFSYRFSSI